MKLPRLRLDVARRVHLSFVLAAALPLFLLAATSYQLVSSRLEQVALDDARQLAKGMGMDVFERLQLLTDQLTLISRQHVTRSGGGRTIVDLDLDLDLDLGERVLGLFEIGDDGGVIGDYRPPTADLAALAAAIAAADDAKPLLVATGPAAQRHLYLLVQDTAHPEHRYIGAGLSLSHLWDTAGVAARPERVCILDVTAAPVFCNQQDYAAWLGNSRALVAARGRPEAIVDGSGEQVLTAAWSLFLKPYYQFERWTVLVGVPASMAYAAIERFDRLFAGIAVIALITAFLFGRRLIGRNLRPLCLLSDATERLAAGDFAHRVTLASGDEFEQLGEAFNGMAARIGDQFGQLDTLARLDRALQVAGDFAAALDAAASALDDLLGTGHCALACHERWKLPGEAWCRGFAAAQAQPCRPPVGRFPQGALDPDLQRRLGIAPGESPHVVAVVESELVAAAIVTRQPGAADREQIARVADVLAIALSNLAMESRLYHQANHDWLSGLPNRARLHDEFAIWRDDPRRGDQIGMLLIGIDRFKQINDSAGHAAGDRLLAKVGQRLRAALPARALLCRFAGDQFVLMHADRDLAELRHALEAAARRINAELDRPIAIGPRDVRLSATMGAAVYPHDAANFGGMLQCLDAASYAAKSSRRGDLLFFTPKMRERLAGRMDIEQALKGALANDEIVLHYQPVVDATSGEVRSAEALMRWQRPGVGLVMPDDFIEIAEQSGLIGDLGNWAIGEVCRQMQAWLAAGLALDTLNVNVSSVQLASEHFVGQVAAALQQSGLEPQRLTLEVTETAMIGRFNDSVARIRALRELGVRIMIDDFGTGYATLKYLKLLPVDGLKIDRLFVKDLPGSRADAAIVTAVVSLARASAFKLVAEGVDTPDQAALLRDAGVPFLQGFLFSKGLAADTFAGFAHERALPARGREAAN
ncbi:MAG: EAL domain-containing protein [Gammaproteobacteria bacterium]|nr:EAL domain-containing protein [Gammaproteobacteria bacterium]